MDELFSASLRLRAYFSSLPTCFDTQYDVALDNAIIMHNMIHNYKAMAMTSVMFSLV